MAEILEEQVESLREQKKRNEAIAGPSAGKRQDENQTTTLPSGVVLDKDGKPYVSHPAFLNRKTRGNKPIDIIIF